MPNRYVYLELRFRGQTMELVKTTAGEARNMLSFAMAPGWRWRIMPPDRTGQLADDYQRYAADCEACGVDNDFE